MATRQEPRKPTTAKLTQKHGKKLAQAAKRHELDDRVKRIVQRQIEDSPVMALVRASIDDEDSHVRVMFNVPAHIEPTEQQRERYRRANEQRMRGAQARFDLEDETLQRLSVNLVEYHISVLTDPKAKRTAKNISAVELRHLMAQRRANVQRVELLPGSDEYRITESELDEIIAEFA